MPDEGEGTAGRLAQHPLGQPGRRRPVGELDQRARGARVVRPPWGARAEAREREHDPGTHGGIPEVVRRHVVLRVDGTRRRERPRPVLAEQGADDLRWRAWRRGQAVPRREQHVGAVRADEQVEEARLGRARADVRRRVPHAGVRTELVAERLDQPGRAQCRGGVVRMARGEQLQASSRGGLCAARGVVALGRDHGRGVGRVGRRVRQVQPPDRVRDAELVLELERDLLGAADQEQVVGHHVRIDHRRPRPVAREEVVLRLAGAHGQHLEDLARLVLPELQQRCERVHDLHRDGLGDHHPPARRGQVVRAIAVGQPEVGLGGAVAAAQVAGVRGCRTVVPERGREGAHGHGRRGVRARRDVDAVELEQLRHGSTPGPRLGPEVRVDQGRRPQPVAPISLSNSPARWR